MREQNPENRDSQQCHQLRSIPGDLPLKSDLASSIFNGIESIDSGSRAADNIRQAEVPFWEAPILPTGQGFIDESGFV
jgi:hypothetical protein